MRYNFCPNCGNDVNGKEWPVHCDSCGKTYYQNAKPGASVLPIKDGKVLLARRGRDPYKGSYDIIGGFMEADELPEIAALREAKEETGLNMNIVDLLGIYVDRYGEDGDYTLNLHYIAELTSDDEPQAMDDIAELEWFDIKNPPENIQFQNAIDGLRDLKRWYEQAGRR